MNVVLDSNIYISSMFWEGAPYIIVKKAIKQEIIVYVSEHIIGEIRRVLGRDFGLSKQEIEDAANSLRYFTHLINPKERFDVIKDDPSDDRILECAAACKAKYIISYNKHLLNINEFKDIKIITPKEFLGLIR